MPRDKKTERRTSSGGVIFKSSRTGTRVAILLRGAGKIWCLPKGIVDKGESSEEAATREVKEETGLKGRVLKKIDDIDYWFVWGNKKIHKVVHFYLMKNLGGSTKDHDYEVEEAKWSSIDQAIKLLTYKNEQKIMKKAKKMIDKLS